MGIKKTDERLQEGHKKGQKGKNRRAEGKTVRLVEARIQESSEERKTEER